MSFFLIFFFMTIMTNTTYELYYSNTDIACWKPMITIFVELIVLREDGYSAHKNGR